MYSKLVEDTTKKNRISEVDVFKITESGGPWTCPFCNPEFEVYKLTVPPASEREKLNAVKIMIKKHMAMHQIEVMNRLSPTEIAQYEKARSESMKRVRLWITGTIKDRRLYEHDPLP